jgi:hypothetical protein
MFPNDVGGGRIMFQLFRAHDDRALSQELKAIGICNRMIIADS